MAFDASADERDRRAFTSIMKNCKEDGIECKIKDQTTNLMGEGIECVLDVALTNDTEMTDDL